MAHIDLAACVAHIWFLKSLPSKIGNLLDLTLQDMEHIYFDSYVVTDPQDTELTLGQVIGDDKYAEAVEKYGHNRFEAGIGTEAVHALAGNNQTGSPVCPAAGRNPHRTTRPPNVRKWANV